MKIIMPNENEYLCLQTESQKKYLAEDRSEYQVDDFYYLDLKMTLKENGVDDSKGGFVSFKWEPSVRARLDISESEEFNDYLTYYGEGSCNVPNLKIGTRYYARVSTDNETSPSLSFVTERRYPRMMNVDGISNVRDVGGYITRDGRIVRQGLFYRGSELNSHVNITENGLKTMRDVLKIKTEIDIRNSSEKVMDVYGGNYYNIWLSAYTTYLEDREQQKKTKQIFDLMTDECNYPIYFHCWGGADRTESFVFLLGLLLGISIEDLINDYEITTLSVFGARSRNKEIFKNYINYLENLEGADLYEKCYNYLLSCEIKAETLDKIKKIFLE